MLVLLFTFDMLMINRTQIVEQETNFKMIARSEAGAVALFKE